MSAPVNGLALGQLDGDFMPDLAVVAGCEVVVVHGRDRKLSLNAAQQATVTAPQLGRRQFQSDIKALVVSDFNADFSTTWQY